LTSGDRQVQLIELYTSEGCSSCPAADRWLSRLQTDRGLWSKFVPLAFHVDYWDYLGWEDKFAEEAFSDRQHLHRSQGNISRVYTPGFVIQGQEWRGWFQKETRPPQSKQKVGELKLILENGVAHVNFLPTIEISQAEINFVVLGFGLGHSILNGENAGTRLEHDFVVLNHQLKPADFSNNELNATFKLKPEPQSSRLAVAAWVTSANQLKPVQTVGGWYRSSDQITAGIR